MRKIFILIFGLMMLLENCPAQNVGIGTASPDVSAQLDISSSRKGILIPRMATAAVLGIANPAKGLMIYDSTRNQLLVNMGTPVAADWENIVAKSGWGLNGNSGTNSGTQFIGTADSASLKFGVAGWFAGCIDNYNNNTSLGIQTQRDFLTGVYNTSVGFHALSNNAGGQSNTTVGAYSMASNISGINNSAFGLGALNLNTIGYDNCALGQHSLNDNVDGNANTAVGSNALELNVSGFGNTAVGYKALSYTDYGSYNTVVGYNSGANWDNGFNNVFVGANNSVNGGNYYNVIAIGQGVICTASSQARIGNPATNSIGGYASWTNFSDGRYKKNMRENVKGIDFIMRLRPLTYNLDVTDIQNKLGARRAADAGSQQAIAEKENIVFSGFSAQEVEQAAKDAGYDFSGVDKPKNVNDFYGLRYSDFVVPLVKGMQEQQQIITDMQKQLAQQARQIAQQAEQIKQLLNKN